jgi:hypothetical protein
MKRVRAEEKKEKRAESKRREMKRERKKECAIVGMGEGEKEMMREGSKRGVDGELRIIQKMKWVKEKEKTWTKRPFIEEKKQCTKTISTIAEQQTTTNIPSIPHTHAPSLSLTHPRSIFYCSPSLAYSLSFSISFAIIDNRR